MEDYEVVQQVFEKKVEEHTFDPCFVTRVASELIPLAKVTPGGKTVEVYELIINGQEISPGYSELKSIMTSLRLSKTACHQLAVSASASIA